MFNYPAIWKVDLDFDAELLFNEFKKSYPENLKKVYSENNNWKGVTIVKKGEVLSLNNLPELESLVKKIGNESVIGISYFNLEKNSELHEHRDMNGNLLFGIVRIHIPIKTNDEALMIIERTKYQLQLGSAWCLDTSGLHGLVNGDIDNRIHLVIDIKRSSNTNRFFPRWSFSVILHLTVFVFVMSFKIARDLLMNPRSLIKRLNDKIKEYV
jgi:hypothetical protein